MPPCPHCGTPLTPGGYALACGSGGKSARIPLPATCTDRDCPQQRDNAAIERAIAAGVIDR